MKKDEFIEVYNDVLNEEECTNTIAYFEHVKKLNYVFNRQKAEKTPRHLKEDETCFLFEPDILVLSRTQPMLQPILKKFWECYNHYSEKYSIIEKSASHGILSMRLQKTKPGGGYHNWHYETEGGRLQCSRLLTFMIYLNTITAGGETEFIYQNTRVNSVAGRVVIWPAGFTHTHRGNQPIDEEKYAITGWVEFLE